MDIEGNRYGKVVVIGRSTEIFRKDAWWVCQCDCGQAILSSYSHLNSGHTSSCGCENARQWTGKKAPQYRHGKSHAPEYSVWTNMKNRCYNVDSPGYYKHGGRGIRICQAWLDSFEQFYKDMGPRPNKDYSIERIDNYGDYEPSNCKWATRSEQMKNRRPYSEWRVTRTKP